MSINKEVCCNPQNTRLNHVSILTIGSLGDIQPYIYFGKYLMSQGIRVKIITHCTFENNVKSVGLQYYPINFSSKKLMKMSVKYGMFTPSFIKHVYTNLKNFIKILVTDAYTGVSQGDTVQGSTTHSVSTDLLIATPASLIGRYIAHLLGVKYIEMFTMPVTCTSQFPHAYLSNVWFMPNKLTYFLVNSVIQLGIRNRLVKLYNSHGTKSDTIDFIADKEYPIVYIFNKFLIQRPIEWEKNVHVTGSLVCNTPEPGKVLDPRIINFIYNSPNIPVVYIGFGSIIMPYQKKLLTGIIRAVKTAGVRCILARGWISPVVFWSIDYPGYIYPVDSINHSLLFPMVSIAIHHGGSGTVAMCIKSGTPMIIKPFFCDQYLWADSVQNLGIGKRVDNISELDRCILDVLNDQSIKRRCGVEKLRVLEDNPFVNAFNVILSEYTIL